MSIKSILYLLAAVCFLLGAAGVAGVNWQSLGFFRLTLSLLV